MNLTKTISVMLGKTSKSKLGETIMELLAREEFDI
jgi:hypothetical protein